MQIHKVLILKSTSEIGYFSNAWKLNHNIPPKKTRKGILSKFSVIKGSSQKIVWLVVTTQIILFKKIECSLPCR